MSSLLKKMEGYALQLFEESLSLKVSAETFAPRELCFKMRSHFAASTKQRIFDATGNEITQSNFTNPYGFTGRETDAESPLYYYRARYYSPESGRFLSPDPIGLAGGDTNFYRYVKNNPIRFTDPLGLLPGDEFTTESAAGYDAIQYINQASIEQNREYAGTVYSTGTGYSYTAPIPGGAAGADPGPISQNTTSIYHTHAGYDPQYDNENFSPADTNFSSSYNIGSYLGTPSESTQYQSPSGSSTRLGGANSCGF